MYSPTDLIIFDNKIGTVIEDCGEIIIIEVCGETIIAHPDDIDHYGELMAALMAA